MATVWKHLFIIFLFLSLPIKVSASNDSCFDFDEEYVGECCQKYMNKGDNNLARSFCADACRSGHKDSCFQYAHILSSSNAETSQKIYDKLCQEKYDKACEFKGIENLERTDDANVVINKPQSSPPIIKKERVISRPVVNTRPEGRKIDKAVVGRDLKNEESVNHHRTQESGGGTLIIFLFALLLVGILIAIFREKRLRAGKNHWPSYDHDQAIEELMVHKKDDVVLRSEFEKFKGRVLDLVFQNDINQIKDLNKEEKTIIVDVETPPPLKLIKNDKNSSDFLYDK